jgi:RNA polymerase sigma factor (sigma-70 family)
MSILDNFKAGCELDDFFDAEDIAQIEARLDAQRRFNALPRREKEVVLYHCLGYTQKEIGDVIGYTQARISQILSKIYILP